MVRVGGARFAAILLASTMLSAPLIAQTPADVPTVAPPTGGIVKTITVEGAQRLEPDTVRSYIDLKPGDSYNREALDRALKALFATELFADVQIRDNSGALVIQVKENPVINRIVLEGNKRLKEDKIKPEIRLAPRQIFSRSKVRADVARIIELYRRQGRFAATVEPKMVMLDQNRVDVVFEITEGPKSKVRKINIIGNKKFSDGRLRGEMATKQSGITKIFSSGTSYDPDRLAYDQQKLRQFYLTNGYADFRVISAVAELTPDKHDFIITYVVEEGERYHFGDVNVESDIRDLKPETLRPLIKMRKGQWYNAKQVEDTVDTLSETAGLLGYAFADIQPQFDRDKDARTMSVTFKVADAPRVYVERIDINGNTHTKDKVARREFRLAEGDAFNSFKVKRSRDRIQSLGFFQDKLEIEQKRGSTPDKVILEANVEEKSTGELQVSAGYSSLERFIVSLGITEHNFMGKGQELRASVDYSKYSKSIELGFTEPYVFDKNIALGWDIFRRDYNSFNFTGNGNDRRTTYNQVTTGFQLRLGVPLTEFTSLALRYGLSYDDVSLDKSTYFVDTNGDGTKDTCSPVIAGRYLCDALGKRLTSSVGYSFVFDNLNNRLHPTRGQRVVFSQDLAGLGGDVRYIKSTVEAHKYWGFGKGFVFSVNGEGGYIKGLGQDVRLTDRFFLGEPQIRGFDIRGIGPRIKRTYLQDDLKTPLSNSNNNISDDALGGRAYYLGRLELELPLGSGGRELGLRPSIFMDAGAVFGIRRPNFQSTPTPGLKVPALDSNGKPLFVDAVTGASTPNATASDGTANKPLYSVNVPAFVEQYFGNSAKPRLSIGFGVNWNSPFGPFRIDVAKALLKQKGDDTKLFSFNVGTQF
jgi:outer membrane protein insertion porin family